VAGDGGQKDAELVDEPIVISWWQDEDDDEPLTSAAVTQRIRARFDALYPPGNLAGDLTRFIEAAYFGCDPGEAAIALARHRRFLPTRLASPVAKGRIRRLIREQGGSAERYLRDVLYPQALFEALRGRTQAQHIRLRIGCRFGWLKDAAGRRLAFRPDELPGRSACGNALFARWLRKEAVRHVERLLAEDLGEADTNVRPERPSAFYGRRPFARQFFGRLSAADQALLRLLENQNASFAKIGADLGISRDAAKKRVRRLRLKLEHC
jgi:hypothetical protein